MCSVQCGAGGHLGLPSVEPELLLQLPHSACERTNTNMLRLDKTMRVGAAGCKGGSSTPFGSISPLCYSVQARRVELDASYYDAFFVPFIYNNEQQSNV